MQKYRVLFYTGSFTHPMYRELYASAPEGIQFIPSSPALESTGMKEDIARGKERLYQFIVRAKTLSLDITATMRIPVVKARTIEAEGVDLIHSAQYLLQSNTPWVVDFEDITSFVWYRRKLLEVPRVRQKIRKFLASPYCRKILPWTEAAKQSLLNSVGGDGFDEKLQVVYPCIWPRSKRDRLESEVVHILFVGTNFYQKGGMETLLAFEKVCTSYPVRLTMVCYVPTEIRERYKGYKNITFKSRIPVTELEEEYEKADLFVLPVHTDTFGFVFLEAFSRGIPCVSTKHFAIPEIIIDGKTGVLINSYESYFDERCLPRYDTPVLDDRHPMFKVLRNPPSDYVEQLAEAIAHLVANSKLRQEMGEAGYQEVLTGRFSYSQRRKIMAQVYQDSLQS